MNENPITIVNQKILSRHYERNAVHLHSRQRSLWEEWEANSPEIIEVADQFIFANCYNPQVAGSILQKNRASG
jgi:hypothetical protein